MLVLKATGYSQNYAGIIAAPLFMTEGVCMLVYVNTIPLVVKLLPLSVKGNITLRGKSPWSRKDLPVLK